MFCPYCGKEIGEDFVYCLNCGRELPFKNVVKTSGSLAQQCVGRQMRENNPAETTTDQKDDGALTLDESKRLEADFRACVNRLPREALSHFKNVDKDVWEVVKDGAREEYACKRRGLVGPYDVRICGVMYHAYAMGDRLASSQIRFLRVWGGRDRWKDVIYRPVKEPNSPKRLASHDANYYVKSIAIFVGIVILGYFLARLCPA